MALLDYPDINISLLRYICLQKLYLHISSLNKLSSQATKRLFVDFSVIIVLHCIICFAHLNFAKAYCWRYWVMTDIYIIWCKYLLYCDKYLIYLHYRHQNVIKNQHLHKDFFFFLSKVKKYIFWLLFKVSGFMGLNWHLSKDIISPRSKMSPSKQCLPKTGYRSVVMGHR